MREQVAVVVLGCRPHVHADGRVRGAIARRVAEAARTWHALSSAGERAIIVASGGARMKGVAECDAMARELVALGVPAELVVRERCSLFTRENARYAADTLRARGFSRAKLVTCAWHMRRAAEMFRAEGIEVEEVPVAGPPLSGVRRAWRWGKERVALRIDRAFLRGRA